MPNPEVLSFVHRSPWYSPGSTSPVRDDRSGGPTIAWAVFIFPIVPFIYVLTGGDLR